MAVAMLPTASLAAVCSTHGSASAGAIRTETPEAAKILVNLGVWLTILGDKGLDPALKEAGLCERAHFVASGADYELKGEDDAKFAPRVATPAAKDGTVAYMLPVREIGRPSTTGGPPAGVPPVPAYALITAKDGRHTVWRLYNAIPGDEALTRDMTVALSGQQSPLMRWADGKIDFFVVPANAPANPPPKGPQLKAKVDETRLRTFAESAYTLGGCQQTVSEAKDRLTTLTTADRLRLEAVDENQRAIAVALLEAARKAGADRGRWPVAECERAFPRLIQQVTALP